jgi:hypothetical protein
MAATKDSMKMCWRWRWRWPWRWRCSHLGRCGAETQQSQIIISQKVRRWFRCTGRTGFRWRWGLGATLAVALLPAMPVMLPLALVLLTKYGDRGRRTCAVGSEVAQWVTPPILRNPCRALRMNALKKVRTHARR